MKCELAILAAALGICAAEARTVSVASFDRDTGAVELALDAGADGESARALLAAWNPSDAGEDATAWRETALVAEVDAAATAASFTIPSEWRAKSGAVRFFLMEKTAPYAVRYDAITGGPGPWIDTGVQATTDIDLRVTAAHDMDMAPFGISGLFYLFANTKGSDNAQSSYFYMFFGAPGSGGGSTATAPRGTGLREHRLNATGAYIDGERYATHDPSKFTLAPVAHTVSLFGRRDKSSGAIAKQQGTCTISAARIEVAGEPRRFYVPCRTREGVVTLYDRVTETCATVQGSGTFTAGTDVGPAAVDCGAVESATDAIRFAPALAVGAKDLVTGAITVTVAGAHDAGVVIAVADTEDRGTDLAAWSRRAFVAKVAADVDEVTALLPQAWWNDGLVVRFFWKSAADFPYDQELEYVESAGAAFVDTGWVVTPQSEVAVTAKCPADVCYFGIATYFYLFTNGGTTFWGFFGKAGSAMNYLPNERFRELRLGPTGAFLDGGRLAEISGGTYTALKTALPVPFRRDGSSGAFSKTGVCQVKAAKIWERGTLVRDYVPCRKDGVAGLYDRVQAKFCPSSVSTAFTAGPVVAPAAAGDALAWSAPVSLAPESSSVWDGGGSDTAFSTAANWLDDVLPNLTDGTSVPTFAAAGASATVTGPVNVRGLKFNARNDFTLRAQGAGAVLSVGVGGITMADDPDETIAGDWRKATFECPLELTASQTWDLSPNAKRRIQLPGTPACCVSGPSNVTLTITGRGCLGLVATNTFKGDVRIEGGVLKVLSKKGIFGSADEGGTVYLDMASNDVTWDHFGGVIDKPLVVTGGKDVLSSKFYCHKNYGTNVFAAPVTVKGGTTLRTLLEGDTVFAGGLKGGTVSFTGTGGNLYIREKPVTGGTLEFWQKREVHFEVPGNTVNVSFGGQYSGTGNELHLWAEDVFHDYQSTLNLTNATTLNLHGFSQKCGPVQLTDARSVITSDAPATLFAFHNAADMTYRGTIRGQVTFEKSGGNYVMLTGKNTSTGALFVHNGPLEIYTTGSWKGTEVKVGDVDSNRNPKLRLFHGNCFDDPRHTVLTMTTTRKTGTDFFGTNPNPVLELEAGVEQVFKDIYIDGRRLASGTWGSSQSPARHKDDVHFAGTGVANVIGTGMVIIFR